uniref:Putative replication protein RepA n=1 Tax=Bifidobacterium pseudocatenulatum TaxID=28026 RepID=Q8RPR8_BIFPS|nr:replication protein RepA [Bifidobacterium pseudocatenulatum]AAM00235.1 putative replication protein RepA [Bifidobacterium pseudocatenulatum]
MEDKRETGYTDWLLTIRRELPDGSERTVDDVVNALQGIFDAAIGQPEKGEGGYRHYQIFAQGKRQRFSTLKKKLTAAGLGDAHVEPRKGSVSEAVGYCSKEKTRDGDGFQFGQIDRHEKEDSHQGERSDLARLKARAEAGETVSQILLSEDGELAARYLGWLRATCDAAQAAKYRTKVRDDLEVNFLYGETGVGKTSHVYESEGIGTVYTVTDYAHAFDKYEGEGILLLDEFTGQFPMPLMLKLLDKWPMQLPARYSNRWAAFSRIWVVSNLPPNNLYSYAPESQRRAFFRRFAHFYKMDEAHQLIEEPNPLQPVVSEFDRLNALPAQPIEPYLADLGLTL